MKEGRRCLYAVYGWDRARLLKRDRNADPTGNALRGTGFSKANAGGGEQSRMAHAKSVKRHGGLETSPRFPRSSGRAPADDYRAKLDVVRGFLVKLRGRDAKRCRLRRPFPRDNGSWLWWGRDIQR